MNAIMTSQPDPPKAKRGLTAEAFEKFLRWLSEDREMAGQEYERVRARIVRYLTRKGCDDPDHLFDETIDRAAGIIDRNAAFSTPLALCFGVAKNVWRENRRPVRPDPLPEDDRLPELKASTLEREREARCLDSCLAKLPEASRDLITRYYQGKGREKIELRRALAKEHGGEELLRIKAFRIRGKLRVCVDDCLKRASVN